jgi:hypothetical protein
MKQNTNIFLRPRVDSLKEANRRCHKNQRCYTVGILEGLKSDVQNSSLLRQVIRGAYLLGLREFLMDVRGEM